MNDNDDDGDWFSEGTEYTKAFAKELQENMNKQQTSSTMPLTSDEKERGDDFLTVEDEYTRQARKELEEFRSRSTVKEPRRQVTTVQGAVKVTSDNVHKELSLCQEELRRTKEENRRLVEENKRLKAAIN